MYYVDNEGGRLKGDRFSVGSGSPYAYGVLDSGYVSISRYHHCPTSLLVKAQTKTRSCFTIITTQSYGSFFVNRYKFDMSVEEASELARRSIYHATFRDGASGGVASGKDQSLLLLPIHHHLVILFL